MMTKTLELLQNCRSITDLKPLLHAICLGFGSVARADILISSQVGKRQALCFLRMATPEQEEMLMRELGVGRFGGDIVVIVDLKSTSDRTTPGQQRPTMQPDQRRLRAALMSSFAQEPFMTSPSANQRSMPFQSLCAT